MDGQLTDRRFTGGILEDHGYAGRHQAQRVPSQASYLSCSDRRLHFGLGRLIRRMSKFAWPNGSKQSFSKVVANQLVVIREGAAAVERAPLPGR